MMVLNMIFFNGFRMTTADLVMLSPIVLILMTHVRTLLKIHYIL